MMSDYNLWTQTKSQKLILMVYNIPFWKKTN